MGGVSAYGNDHLSCVAHFLYKISLYMDSVDYLLNNNLTYMTFYWQHDVP